MVSKNQVEKVFAKLKEKKSLTVVYDQFLEPRKLLMNGHKIMYSVDENTFEITMDGLSVVIDNAKDIHEY